MEDAGLMERYRSTHDDSGVAEFEIGPDWIVVRFKDGGTYKYTYKSAGSSNIEKMKTLARQGFGLNTFINRNVKKNYETKIV